MSDKVFSPFRVSCETAFRWMNDATKKGAEKIIVSYADNHFRPHPLLVGEDEGQIINESVNLRKEVFVGVVEVKDLKNFFNL